MKMIFRFLTLVVFLCFYACQDEEFLPSPDDSTLPNDRATSVVNGSALTQNSSGNWVASRRVPLVGAGRIVDNISDALISVLGGQNGVGNMIDVDITNSTSFAGVANVQAVANQIASVRDISRTYEGGQTAGFVYKINNTGLLTLNVLKGFWIQTLLKGVPQETKGGNTSGQTLELNVLSAANNDGKQSLSLSTTLTKPFDEVRIGMNGISADVLQALTLYYAFVGDNPILTATTNNTAYFTNGVVVHKDALFDPGWTSMLTPDNAIDSNLTNGAGFGTLGALLTDPTLTINFKKVIPTGTEVGFLVTDANILNLGLLNGSILRTYDVNNVQQEEVSITNLLGVSAIGGGQQMVSLITTKPCTQAKIIFTGLNVSVGVTVVNYAYVREPVVIDASSYLSLSNTTITGNTFQFAVPSAGTMSFAIVSQPSGAAATISGNRIAGMNVNGNYVVTATYAAEDGSTYSQTVTITRNAQPVGAADCNTLLTNSAYGATVYSPPGGGSLLSLEGFTEADLGKIVDNDPDNYITYLKGISIAGNYAIIGIKTGAGKTINPSHAQIRTGFTVQPSSTLLGTDLLRFFRLRLKLGSNYVYDSLTSGNSAVSAGLIGDSGSRIRLSVTTNVEYDAIELWTSGLLSLNLGTLRLYNAFWESVSSNCYSGGVADACLELVTSASNGATINYAATGSAAVASVGTSFNNLGNLLDNDKESVALITTTTVAGGVTVAVKFNPMTPGQEIGFIAVSATGIADLNLLQSTTLSVYSNGVKVDSKSSAGVLGADIIGYGAKSYISTIPTASFDEVRITFAGAVNALNAVQLAGVFVRPDTNGDGIPDCAEGGSGGTNPINRAEALSAHVCEGDPVVILVDGGTVGTTYQLSCNDITPNNSDRTVQMALAVGGTFTINALPAGDYYIGISSADGSQLYYNGVHATVHPKKSTWKLNAGSSDWNEWNNWDSGSPWDCTDVVIPTNATVYPVLTNVANYCHYMHFEPGAEVVNTHYLHYQKAWVGLALTPGRYYMLSAPLKDMVTGDMFIPSAMNGTQNNTYFTALNSGSSPENRFAPRIYQRLWSNNAPGKKIDGDVTVTPDNTNWTPPFNALNQAYAIGSGFSLMGDKERLSNSVLTFRFPKEHSVYNYYNASGGVTTVNEPITRSSQTGRFIYENPDGSARTFPFTVTATNQKPGNTFLVGNPFMAHININAFLQANSSITSIKVYDGNSNNSLIKIDGQLVSNGSNYTHIAPMQSFFVTVPSASGQLTINFTEGMLAQAPGNNGLLRSSRAVASSRPTLRVTASVGQSSSQCLLLISPKASAAYKQGEDAELLLDNEVIPAVAVFSEADGKALDIQQLNDAERISLGFSLRNAARVTLKLNHTQGDAWSKWTLVDTKTGNRYSLSQSDVTVDAGTLDTHAGRFYLEKN